MNKQELVKKIAEASATTQKQAAAVLDSAFAEIMAAVAAGDKVQIIGFGIFEAKSRKARLGHNPQTNESIKIPATTVPSFKAGKEFKDVVKG